MALARSQAHTSAVDRAERCADNPNLYNLALPLIRYELTDQVTMLSKPFP
jgi:hypothetical protein